MRNVIRTRVAVALMLALLCAGIVAGWMLNGRLAVSLRRPEKVQGSFSRGNAPAATREEVLVALRIFQEGYAKRDVAKLDAFMSELFAQSDDVQLLGTDADEWNRGFSAVRKFIGNDWTYWGNVHFDLNEATISARGESAWIALPGQVDFASGSRRIRLTGTLTKLEGKWKFVQVQFQWLDRKAGLRDLLRPSTLKALRWL